MATVEFIRPAATGRIVMVIESGARDEWPGIITRVYNGDDPEFATVSVTVFEEYGVRYMSAIPLFRTKPPALEWLKSAARRQAAYWPPEIR